MTTTQIDPIVIVDPLWFKKSKKRVYIAGPYTKGDVAQNVRRAIDTAETLINLGFIVYVPHLLHFWHIIYPKTYGEWMAIGREWLDVCDALLRLRGDSEGADNEVAYAMSKDIPVFYSIIALERWDKG